ncbi:unnamed protein product [Mortierella alpina]
MGNPAFWELLNRLQVTPKEADPLDMGTVHIDVLACFFSFITSRDYFITRRMIREKMDHETFQDLQNRRIARLATALDARMSAVFDKATAILHIDGRSTIQKRHAHEKRSVVHGKQLTSLNEKVTKVSSGWQAKTSASRRKLKKLYRSAQKQWRRTIRVDRATRVALAQALRIKGWQTCQSDDETGTCRGEADVCVGITASRRPRELGPLVVATTDSDLLVYNNVSVLRQHPRRKSSYSLYVQDEYLPTLNKNRPKVKRGKKAIKRVQVLTPEVWKVLAIVSGSDYDANVKEFGVRKNWAILADIWSRIQPASETDLLRAYRQEMSTTRNKEGPLLVPEFRHGASVFLNLKEDTEEDAPDPATHEKILQMMASYARTVQACKAAQGDQTMARRATGVVASTKGYVRHFRTSGNPYRPKRIKPRSLQPVAATQNASTMREKRDLAEREAQAQAAGTELVRHRRKTNLGQLINQAVGSKYETVTMNVGTIRACLQGALPKCVDAASADLLTALTCDITSTMAGLAKLGSDLSVLATLALQHHIATVMAQHPSIHDARARSAAFMPLCKGQSFFPALVKQIYKPTAGYDKRDTADARAGKDAARAFLSKFESDLIAPLERMRQHLDHRAPKGFLEFIARHLSDTFRSHVDHYIVILKRRVLTRAPGWSTGEASTLLRSINDKTGKSTDHDPVSLTWLMNAALTEDLRISLCPRPGWKDGFVTLSETYLYEALTRSRNSTEEAQLVEQYQILFKPEEGTADADGEVDIFANHRGQMTRNLFLSGRTNFSRHGAVGNPGDKSLPSLFDFSTPAYQEAIAALEGAGGADYTLSKKHFKELVQLDLGSRYPRPPYTGQQTRDRKYLLCGSFCTDGYQVKLLAYHLDHTKKEQPTLNLSPSSSSPSSSSPSSSSPARTYRRKAPYINEAIKTPHEIKSALGEGSRLVGSIDPGLRKPATFMVEDTLDPQYRLIIDIPCGDLAFNERLFRSRLNRAKKDEGINEIEQSIVGFCLPAPPAWFSNQPLPDQPLPNHSTVSAPHHADVTASPSQSSSGSRDATTSPSQPSTTFQEPEASFTAHTRSILSCFTQLRTFYGSDKYKRWKYQEQQGLRAEYGRAVNSILSTLQTPTHDKHPYMHDMEAIRGRQPILGIGDGNFAKVWSGADKSGKFRDVLVGEALGRGILTVQLDEFRTSATCCECGSKNKAQGRSVVCQEKTCGIMKDRDHNAVHNMTKGMVMWTTRLIWPQHLIRDTVVKIDDEVPA